MWENINDKKRKIRLGFDETYSKTSNDDVVQSTSVLREKELVELSKTLQPSRNWLRRFATFQNKN